MFVLLIKTKETHLSQTTVIHPKLIHHKCTVPIFQYLVGDKIKGGSRYESIRFNYEGIKCG